MWRWTVLTCSIMEIWNGKQCLGQQHWVMCFMLMQFPALINGITFGNEGIRMVSITEQPTSRSSGNVISIKMPMLLICIFSGTWNCDTNSICLKIVDNLICLRKTTQVCSLTVQVRLNEALLDGVGVMKTKPELSKRPPHTQAAIS